MSQSAFAACDDPDSYTDCMDVTGDDDYFGGSGEGSGVGTGNGGSGGSGDWEREFKKCEQASKSKLSVCNAQASANYDQTLEEECKGLGTITVSAGGYLVITIDEYAQCKDEALSEQKNAENVCTVLHNNRVSACH